MMKRVSLINSFNKKEIKIATGFLLRGSGQVDCIVGSSITHRAVNTQMLGMSLV